MATSLDDVLDVALTSDACPDDVRRRSAMSDVNIKTRLWSD
jgi:hypothetical protein